MPWIACLTWSQHAVRSLTVTWSVPGEVLETPMVFCSTSSREVDCLQSRVPDLFQLLRGSWPKSSLALNHSRTLVLRASAFSNVSLTMLPLTLRGGDLRLEVSLCQPMILYSDLLSLTPLMMCFQYSHLALQMVV